jgi:hypothetical protein
MKEADSYRRDLNKIIGYMDLSRKAIIRILSEEEIYNEDKYKLDSVLINIVTAISDLKSI